MSKLEHLIQLIDDPDEQISKQVRDEIIAIGDSAIPELEEIWEENSFEPYFRERVEDLIHTIQFQAVTDGLTAWSKNPDQLIEGCYWICRYQYPELELEDLQKDLDALCEAFLPSVTPDLSPRAFVNELNKFLYRDVGFRGNKKHFHAPQNNFLNDVLSSKKGNPLLLSVVNILISAHFNHPIKGINLPNHFVAGYTDILEEEVKFYINPFSKGSILLRQDLVMFLHRMKFPVQEQFLVPCTNLDIIKRMIINLIYGYSRIGHNEKVEELKELEKKILE